MERVVNNMGHEKYRNFKVAGANAEQGGLKNVTEEGNPIKG